MEVINENYILLSFEFKENKSGKLEQFYISLMGDVNYYDILNESKKKKNEFFNVPKEINKDFVGIIKKKHGKELKKETKYLFPIDFSVVKRIFHTYEVERFKDGELYIDKKTGETYTKTRFVNKPPGYIALYKYMGPIIYINEFLSLVKESFLKWQISSKNIFSEFDDIKIYLSSELDYLEEIINHNFFTIRLEFKSVENADPNDFRRALLGEKRKYKGKEVPFNPNVPDLIKERFLEKLKKKKYQPNLDEKIKFAYPIEFSIIKRPIILYKSENGTNKTSSRAAGIIFLYKYMGPITLIESFKNAIQEEFIELNKTKKLFQKVNEPLLLIGAEITAYEGF